jgi:hypothetical protein
MDVLADTGASLEPFAFGVGSQAGSYLLGGWVVFPVVVDSPALVSRIPEALLDE